MKLGNKLNLEIIRRGGHVDNYGELHNLLSTTLIQASAFLSASGTATFSTYTTRIRYPMDGTWQYANGVVSRVTGTGTIDIGPAQGRAIRFANGEIAYTISTGSPTSNSAYCRVDTVSPQAATLYNLSAGTTDDRAYTATVTPNSQILTGNDLYTDYAGVIDFVPSLTNYTLRRIGVNRSNGATGSGYIDLDEDVPVLIGDVVRITSYSISLGWDTLAARPSGTALITGLGAGCQVLRQLPATVTEAGAGNITKIWLLNAAQALPLTPMSLATVAPAAITTSLAELTALGVTGTSTTLTNPSASNGYQSRQAFWALTPASYSAVKQVVWGNATYIAGIYELNAAEDIPVDRVLNIATVTEADQVFPLHP